MTAYHKSSLEQFIRISNDEIVGALSKGVAKGGFFANINRATITWIQQIDLLKCTFKKILTCNSNFARWGILLEYPLLRLGKRIDAVLIADDLIIVIEFKMGMESFESTPQRQTEDYALALRDFHERSANKIIIPILCASEAPDGIDNIVENGEFVKQVIVSNGNNLTENILTAYKHFHSNASNCIDVDTWDNSSYKAVPTIIEAAQILYAEHNVREIYSHAAEKQNLLQTTDCLIKIIENAKKQRKKVICFVTGVPGSGKTLTGLNAVYDPRFRANDGNIGTFLSGNMPLVAVVREALAQDYKIRNKTTYAEAMHKVEGKIQHITGFLYEYLENKKEKAPDEHAVVFDEAQRAWDLAHGKKKFGREASEPELFMQIMGRHVDWATIIALVGGGQEIHNGEAGLAEWGRAISKYPQWETYVSPEVLSGGASVAGGTLFDGVPYNTLQVKLEPFLHLPVSVRSFRSEMVAKWVNMVLEGNILEAKKLTVRLKEYPIVLTRFQDRAKEWLRVQVRGNRRCGLLASSGGKRLRAYGVHVHGADDMQEIVHWFLKPHGDVRSSNMLELATSEFACQGLEIDFAGVCWGGDFIWNSEASKWKHSKFKGTKWQDVKRDQDAAFVINKYRVLLTRAREGMVIWIPFGDEKDDTRSVTHMNDTYNYLLNCGIQSID